MGLKEKKLPYQNVARFVKEARNSGRGWSQSEIAHVLGMKNGQFISNVERGLCSMPDKYIYPFCKFTNTNYEDMVNAISMDYKEVMYLEINKGILNEERSGMQTV